MLFCFYGCCIFGLYFKYDNNERPEKIFMLNGMSDRSRFNDEIIIFYAVYFTPKSCGFEIFIQFNFNQ